LQRCVAAQAHHPEAITKKVYFDVKIGDEDVGRCASPMLGCASAFFEPSFHASEVLKLTWHCGVHTLLATPPFVMAVRVTPVTPLNHT
jgi:hypothetical protein